MIIPLLRDLREEVRTGFVRVDERLSRLEAGQKAMRHAMTADTMLSKLVLGEFEERLASVEQQLEALSKKST